MGGEAGAVDRWSDQHKVSMAWALGHEVEEASTTPVDETSASKHRSPLVVATSDARLSFDLQQQPQVSITVGMECLDSSCSLTACAWARNKIASAKMTTSWLFIPLNLIPNGNDEKSSARG